MSTFEATRPTLGDVRERMIRLKDLLRAADQLCPASASDVSAPLYAVLQVSLAEAQHLDALIDELFEAGGGV